MSSHHHSPADDLALQDLKQQLDAKWQAALGKQTLKTERLQLAGRDYIVKYRNLEPVRHGYSWLVSLGCAVFFGVLVRPRRLRAGGLAFEARRLRALAAAGAAVPQLLMETPDYLLLEYCGMDLVSCLQAADSDQRQRWIRRALQLLAEFHRAGLWHGGAQLRNLTVAHEVLNGSQDEPPDESASRLVRIDFEESAGEVLPLVLIQAYDLLLCLHSASDYLDLASESAQQLLREYLHCVARPELARILLRLERLTAFLGWLAPHLTERARNRKDMRRSLRLAALLGALKPELQSWAIRSGELRE